MDYQEFKSVPQIWWAFPNVTEMMPKAFASKNIRVFSK